MLYEKQIEFNRLLSIHRISDGAWIPIDEDNTDYQEFLLYLANNGLTIEDIPVWSPK